MQSCAPPSSLACASAKPSRTRSKPFSTVPLTSLIRIPHPDCIDNLRSGLGAKPALPRLGAELPRALYILWDLSVGLQRPKGHAFGPQADQNFLIFLPF